jgi:hypothetical protein
MGESPNALSRLGLSRQEQVCGWATGKTITRPSLQRKKSAGSPFGARTTILATWSVVAVLAGGWDEQAHNDELPAAISSIKRLFMEY